MNENENMNIPVVLSDMVRKMNDQSIPFWQRQNFRTTVLNIRDFCDREVTKFDKNNIKKK